MESFLQFLQTAKNALAHIKSYHYIHLTIGNESCDLDSTISALAYAYLTHTNCCKDTNDHLSIPVMNIEAKYFHLRTEICHLLEEVGIDVNLLVFKDQIKYADLLVASTETTLVDHHVLSEHDKILQKTVVQIFDHRPINAQEICNNDGMKQTIKLVGSCCTLITQEIINSTKPVLFKELCYLLYATIIFDTIGLNKDHGRTYTEDIVACEYLENILKPIQTRQQLFDALWKVHNDTTNFTSKDLLYRDLKIVQSIPIPGLPMLVEEYLTRGDAHTAVEAFANEFTSQTVVIVGINAAKNVMRDIGIFSTNDDFRRVLVKILNNCKDSGGDLSLTEIDTTNPKILCFRQGNIKLTRKFILPLVNQAAVQLLMVTGEQT